MKLKEGRQKQVLQFIKNILYIVYMYLYTYSSNMQDMVILFENDWYIYKETVGGMEQGGPRWWG